MTTIVAFVTAVALLYAAAVVMDFRIGQAARRRGWFIDERWSWCSVKGWHFEDRRIRARSQ